jgi:uncharacterized protein (DUF433 family)
LHGEPHLLDTRIPSAAIFTLDAKGFTRAEIARIYPEASDAGISTAIEFERSLLRAAAA